ncbi:DNA polymerase III subunit gamma and tau [Haloechinothrix sp. LS1_15]|uniref:DNA polymerase III subunit gamma and tau n=1 Tax=Haloechinothrix sp. LS1_15 TaxID=2652248 RepID=UPI002948A54C|nr:DNA polymerase III subunit gamma and tau [Haloechinothrix sp. LS1_15]MDV6011290.1 DNA polymerase III subunit gamma and tau [Haloechinothrix sp. LS1_15]
MALALYRKYRPATFGEVVGQDHVTVPLRAALAAGRINHAYLFSGPRGCGKTSSARIMARSLNCANGPTDEPCGECDSCVNLAPEGAGSVDVIELDAASHGGVDDARELRDRAFYAPAESRYRVFVIDEAHMVTPQGFNALLKIVEEPPEHLIFIFATTEPDKVLTTIRSRTHHYPFRLVPPGAMRELLERNVAEEGATVEPAVYPLVVRAGGGSARDAQSVMDQLLAGAGPDGVTYERAVALLGFTDASLLDEMIDGLASGDASAVFGTVERLTEAGHDPRRFATDLLLRLRDLVLLRSVPDAGEQGLVAAPEEELTRMAAQAERIGPATLTRYAETIHNGLREMRGATAPRLLLELLCARMMLPAAASDEEGAVLQRLERLERRIAAGTSTAPAEQTPPEQASRWQPPHGREEADVQAERTVRAEPSLQRSAAEQEQPPAPEPEPAQPAEEPERPAWEGEQAAPAPSGQGNAPGSIDAAALRGIWSQLLAAVRASSRSTEAMLTNATVHSVDGSSVVLSHTAEPLARRLSEPRNAEAIAEALHQVLGGQWQVSCVHAGSAPQGGGKQRTSAQPRPAQQPSRSQGPQPDKAPQPGAGSERGHAPDAGDPGQSEAPPSGNPGHPPRQVAEAAGDHMPVAEDDIPPPPEPPEEVDPGQADGGEPGGPGGPAGTGGAAGAAGAAASAHRLLSEHLGARPLE